MPEGPELFLSAQFVNKIGAERLFSGKVTKSEVSWKNPDIEWNYPAYTISAQSRGKEVKLFLNEVLNPEEDDLINPRKRKLGHSMTILVRFGMSGRFSLTQQSEMDKHAHLHFHTLYGSDVLSFVDMRRFGRWEVTDSWSDDRGPCVIQEKEAFRSNVLENLKDPAFNRPICETMLNQKFFNGIGNYLRAEILYRLKIPPFKCAREVLEPLLTVTKREGPDILDLCHIVPLEVTALNCTAYFQDDSRKDYGTFENWLQCYGVKGMKTMADHNNRTVWFTGEPGRMAPSGQKSRKSGKRKVKVDNEIEGAEYVDVSAQETVLFKKETANENRQGKSAWPVTGVGPKARNKVESKKKNPRIGSPKPIEMKPKLEHDTNIRRSERLLARIKQRT